MRKWILLFLLSLLLSGCTKQSEKLQPDNYEGDTAQGISMIIKEGTITPDSVTVLIVDSNENNQKHAYHTDFTIYKKVDQDWVAVEAQNSQKITTLENHFVNDKNELEMNQNWKEMHGTLSAGEYKLVKYLVDLDNNNSSSFSTNFVLE